MGNVNPLLLRVSCTVQTLYYFIAISWSMQFLFTELCVAGHGVVLCRMGDQMPMDRGR